MGSTRGAVLLIYPRYRYLLASSLEEPLGMLYVASSLKRAGWDVRVLDLTFEKDLSRVEEALRDDLDAVGMSVTSPLLDRAVEVLAFIKELRPDLPCVMGGPHASAFPEDGLARGFDYAVVGDGEETMASLMAALRRGGVDSVPGLAFRKADGEVRVNPQRFIADLDSIAFPDRTYLDYSKYEKVGFITTRGCPYKCFYCKPMQDKLFGRKIRRRSPGNVVREIVEVFRLLGKRIVHFRDDTITIGGLEWFQEFHDLLRKAMPEGIQFQCNSRVDQITEEKLGLMKAAGCVQIFFGVESGSQKILDFYQKGTTPDQAVRAFRLCKKFKIQAVAAIMLGAPVETVEDMKLTFRLIRRIKPDNWIVYTTTPFPGNYLYDYAKENNLLRVSRSEEYDNAMNKRNRFMPLELKFVSAHDLQRYANKIDRYMFLCSVLKWRTMLNVLRRPRSAYYKVTNLLRVGNRSKPVPVPAKAAAALR